MESPQGGNFGSGFVTAWLGAALLPGLSKRFGGNVVKRVIVMAIVGGTLSEATGGKFANGALSWAVQAAMANREQINTVGSTGEGGLESASPSDIASADAFLQNDSVNAGQLFCNSNCPWKTPEAAHEAAGNRYLGASRVTRREVAWRVYKVDANSYSFTYGAISAVGAPSASFPAYLKTRGLIYDSSGHTHWDSNYQFSGQDWLFITQGRASGNGHTLYLATGDGSLQYAPPDLARNLARMQGARMIPYRDNFSGIRVNNVILKATYP